MANMTKPLAIALLMSGCVFGAETSTVVGPRNSLVQISEVRAETDQGMQPVLSATFVPNFATGANDLSFDAEGWSGTVTLEDLASTIQSGGVESILIERGGSAEVQPILITTSEVDSALANTPLGRQATLTFVIYIENRSVQVVVELDVAAGYGC
jgi:hypothetical protein